MVGSLLRIYTELNLFQVIAEKALLRQSCLFLSFCKDTEGPLKGISWVAGLLLLPTDQSGSAFHSQPASCVT